MQKVITIVIPAYNMQEYLDQCVSSILRSNKKIWNQVEILIINDGSIDQTSSIAHSYQNRYSDVIVAIDKENGNYGSCVNLGLSFAHGKYVKILDADDCFDTDAFSAFVEYLSSIDVDLVVTEFNKVSTNNAILWSSRYGIEKKGILSVDDLNLMPIMEMHALCYRTEMLRDHGYEQTIGISFTDTEWSIIPMLYVRSFVCLPCHLYQYLVGREGQTMDLKVAVKRSSHFIQTFSKCINWIEKEKQLGIMSLYAERKTYDCIKFLYYILLVDDRGNNCQGLIEFDNFLKQKCPDYYSQLESVVLSKSSNFPYILYWRLHGYKVKGVPLKYKIRNFFYRNIMRIEWHRTIIFCNCNNT